MPQPLCGTLDYITWYRSPSTGGEFPIYTFSADVDFATSGLLALTSIEKPEIVRGEYTTKEWNAPTNSTLFAIERRLNRRLGRSDLRYPFFFASDPDQPSRSKLFDRDLFVKGEEATPVRRVTVEEFLASGGTIIDCPGRHRKAAPAKAKSKPKKLAQSKQRKAAVRTKASRKGRVTQ